MLLLSSIEIENFRGIRDGKVEGLTEVNVLIGRNNCGKTTLAEAICRAVGRIQQADIAARVGLDYWRVVRREMDNAGLHNRAALGVEPKARFTVKLSESSTEQGEGEVTTDYLAHLVHQDRSATGGRGNSSSARLKINEYANRALGQAITVFRPPDAMDTRIEAHLWPILLQDRSDKKLAAALNNVFSLNAESFQLLPNGKLQVLFENHSVPLDSQGDGTRAAMRALMLLTALKQTLFIMEEPECHQHPGSLKQFAKAVCNLAKTNEVQLIVSTHSGECVRAFMEAAEGAKSSAAVFHLSLTDGIQTARRLDPDAVQTLTDTGVDVRFLDLYS